MTSYASPYGLPAQVVSFPNVSPNALYAGVTPTADTRGGLRGLADALWRLCRSLTPPPDFRWGSATEGRRASTSATRTTTTAGPGIPPARAADGLDRLVSPALGVDETEVKKLAFVRTVCQRTCMILRHAALRTSKHEITQWLCTKNCATADFLLGALGRLRKPPADRAVRKGWVAVPINFAGGGAEHPKAGT